MANDDFQGTEVVRFGRQLASLAHNDDVLERFLVPEPPVGVSLAIDSMGNNPERVRSFILTGAFDVALLIEQADQVNEFDRQEVVSCWFFGQEPEPPSWACTIDFSMQHRGTVDRLVVEPLVVEMLSLPDDPRSATQPVEEVVSPAPPTPTQPDPPDPERSVQDTPVVLTFARQLIAAMYANNLADHVRAAVSDVPAAVPSYELKEFGAAAARTTTSASVFGAIDVSMVMEAARHCEDRFGTPMSFAWFDAIDGDDPAHGAAISMVGKPGEVIGSLHIQTDVISDTPPPSYAVIGSTEAVPAFDAHSVLDSHQFEVLDGLRSYDGDLWELALFELENPEWLYFGTSPAFFPVVNLMVDGMRLGFMVDAPELGRAEPYMILMGMSMDGMVVADREKLLTTFVARRLFDRRADKEGDADYAQWHADALRLLHAIGLEDPSFSGSEGFTLSTKRRRPLNAPKGSKWRNDSGGNGVLAAKEAWGKASVRRPTTIAAALRGAAANSAPAAALYCAQEALVLANAENLPKHVSDAYAAMITPLDALGRPQVAARATALAELNVER